MSDAPDSTGPPGGEQRHRDRAVRPAVSKPTRTSTVIVVVVSVAAAWVLTAQVGPGLSAWLAAVDAVVLTASLWLATRERWRPVAAALAGVLALFVGAGFVAAIGYGGVIVGVEIAFSLPISQLPKVVLQIGAATMVLAGATLAIIGGVASIDDTLGPEAVRRYAVLSIKTFVAPFLLAVVMLLTALLSHAAAGDATTPGELTGDIVEAFLSPFPGRTHIATFSVLLLVTAVLLSRALNALPVAELLADREDALSPADAIAYLRRGLKLLAALAGLGLLAGLLEFVMSPFALESLLTPPVYGLLAWLTGAAALRVLLVLVGAVSLAVVVAVGTLRRVVRRTDARTGVRLAPLLSGVVVVLLALTVHDPVVDATIAFVAGQLPEEFAEQFSGAAWNVVGFYGSATLVVTAAAVLVWLTTMLAVALAAAARLGYLSEEHGGSTLASVGLLVAAAFAGGYGAGPAVVLGGVVCSLLVWDAGAFAATLGAEVGRGSPTRRVELVHAGGTLAVGVLASVAAVWVLGFATGNAVGTLDTVPFAVVGAVAGLVAVLAALR